MVVKTNAVDYFTRQLDGCQTDEDRQRINAKIEEVMAKQDSMIKDEKLVEFQEWYDTAEAQWAIDFETVHMDWFSYTDYVAYRVWQDGQSKIGGLTVMLKITQDINLNLRTALDNQIDLTYHLMDEMNSNGADIKININVGK